MRTRPRTPVAQSGVLHLLKGLGPGGAENLLVVAAKFRSERFDKMSVAYLLPWKNHLVPRLEELGVQVHCLAVKSPLDLRWVLRLVRLLRRVNPEIVHIHSPLVAAIARPVLAVTPKRPRILSEEHNSWASHARGTRWANRATMRLGDAWLAVSHDVLASIPSSLRGRVKVVTHGIDVEAVRSHASLRQPTRDALDLAADDIVVLTVANLRRQKAYPDLLKAAEQALDSSSKLVFLAVGQGPLERELHQMHGKLGLGDRFRFLGYRTDIPALMAAADMYVLASSHEGLPLVVMEARAAGLTIVATAVGGVPEVVQDGVDGYLVEPGDWLSLGRRISDLATHPELRESMAGASRRGADRFDGRSAVGVIESHYLSCAAAATS